MSLKNSLSGIHIDRGLVVLKLNYISMTTQTKRKTLGLLHLDNRSINLSSTSAQVEILHSGCFNFL
jgi:hypothetical protein